MTPPNEFDKKSDEFKGYISEEERVDREQLRGVLQERFKIKSEEALENYIDRLYIPTVGVEGPPGFPRDKTIEIFRRQKIGEMVVREPTIITYRRQSTIYRRITRPERIGAMVVGREELRKEPYLYYFDSRGKIVTVKRLRKKKEIEALV